MSGAVAIEENWEQKLSQFLKAELKLRGVKYAELADRLREIGVSETQGSIGNKMARGTFSAVFLAQCLHVIGSDRLRMD